MNISPQYIQSVVSELVSLPHLRQVSLLVNDKTTVKATRQRRYDGRSRRTTFLVTIGAPNFAERRAIKVAKKSGEVFPKRKIKWWPKK